MLASPVTLTIIRYMPRRDSSDPIQQLSQLPPGMLLVLLCMAAVGFVAWEYYQHHHAAPAVQAGTIDVYFSPKGGCEQAIVQEIGKAQRTVDMQAYSFTSKAIEQALADAKARGVAVRAVLDKNAAYQSYSGAGFLQAHGIPTYTDGQHAIAHNKVIIVDEKTVLTGSFNFTNQAEHSNAENLLILHDDPAIASRYEQNFGEHLSHSEPYQPGAAKTEGGRGGRGRGRTQDVEPLE